MKEILVIGIDISKATLDVYVKPTDRALRIDNKQSGFKALFGELKRTGSAVKEILVVMEHTGSYSYQLEKWLQAQSLRYCKLPALEIKRSIGMVRGKNDKIDAQRIAEYGWLRRGSLRVEEPYSGPIMKLKNLLSLRSKLVRDRSGYKCRLKEIKGSYDYKQSDILLRSSEKMINVFTEEIKKVETAIKDLIHNDDRLRKTSDLIQSIKGVGLIVAASMICYTNNFKRFQNARKFNCYAGLAPFTHQSGTTLKGKSRLSHLANKELKTLLNLAAWSAIRHNTELQIYYKRRLTEGMKKMSCMNIIRSKIVSRIFAVAKRETPFVNLVMAA